jgi:pimeloyl-ACP methyl ester carboxylesterase
MATSFSSVSLTPSQKSASWCFLLLEHLDEFAKLAWYLLADGKLVEDTFARTVAKLDMTAFESSIPALAYATRAHSHMVEVAGASHSVYMSHPKEVADLIESAARAVSK